MLAFLCQFLPRTNVLWVQYLTTFLLEKKTYPSTVSDSVCVCVCVCVLCVCVFACAYMHARVHISMGMCVYALVYTCVPVLHAHQACFALGAADGDV